MIYIADQEIKVFYSWQSDLPGNKSRYVIQESIENSVKLLRDTVEVIADRDTKGEYGSPDIVQTIFSKIEDCDLFIADVSVTNKYSSIDEEGNIIDGPKTSPNPNVLLELGYAAKTLGWDRVICILNTDFGKIEELPFDIAHRRLTPFSLEGKSKNEVKRELQDIIVNTVSDLKQNGGLRRIKGNFARHIVGGFDFQEQAVSEELRPIEVKNLKGYMHERDEIINKCKPLVEIISSIHLEPPVIETKKVDSDEKLETEKNEVLNSFGKLASHKLLDLYKNSSIPTLVTIKEKDKKDTIHQIKELFGIELDDEFFCMGNLKSTNQLNSMQKTEYLGTHQEQEKHEKFAMLAYNLSQLKLLDMYIQTFEGMLLIPIAISNCSTVMDNDITVSVTVDAKSANIVLPIDTLFNQEIKGLEGIVYDLGIIKSIFLMPESKEIQYDSDISYDIAENLRRVQNPQFDSSDYGFELKKYIAMPRENAESEFEFTIDSLRPKENKWLGSAILLSPIDDIIKISYKIKSNSSNGELSGDLEYQITKS